MNESRKDLYTRIGLRALLVLLVLGAVYLTRHILFSVLVPFLLALALAALLNPVVRRLCRLGGNRRYWAYACVLVVMLAAAGGLTFACMKIVAEVRALAENWSAICDNLIFSLTTLSGRVEQLIGREIPFEKAVTWLAGALEGWTPSVWERAGSMATGVVDALFSLLVFVVASFFMTADYARFRFLVRDRLPLELRGDMKKIAHAASSAFGGYFRAQLILSAIIFCIILVTLLVSGQPFAILVALIATIFDFIPIFGSGVILVPWGILCLVTGSLRLALTAFALCFACFLFRRFAEPKIVGDQTGLPTLLSIGCIYVGMCYGGIAGMILTPVLCLMAIDLYREGLFDGTLRDLRQAVRDVRSQFFVPNR